ncbi:hypothetical protein jhhlp_003022 [Lomentospora prolificans]|uniref:FAS1 domain-containing protein n=1 Tax=Lomentospora prolificans TaxID=41688 RepID=A0A2N3NFS8_9PEZI|nr:hypothetical protein jhhlp_003022 [Lomentospora prolificans]
MKSMIVLPLLTAVSAFRIPKTSLWDRGSDVGPFTIADVLKDQLVYIADEEAVDVDPLGDHDHEEPTLSIYELISKSEHTTKFAGLVDEHEEIVQLLNNTDAKYTLFVPGNRAFEHLPGDKKPDADFLKALIKYHVADGEFSARELVHTNTVPTIVNEKLLGGEPQRLRASFGFGGLNINFYAKVVKPNIAQRATNGVIHALNHILVPPAMVGRELTFFPSHFSTLLYAYEKTNFVEFIHNVKLNGSTIFVPDNHAFERLGAKANGFLFNTEKGRCILKALLKYQIVANVTLYSDAVYGDVDKTISARGIHRDHYDLVTLLNGKHLSVDVTRFGGFTSLTVNGKVPVVARDAVAKNGVIQVVGKVPLPPHKHHDHHGHHGDHDHEEGEIEIEDLVERLQDYIDEDDEEWVGEL